MSTKWRVPDYVLEELEGVEAWEVEMRKRHMLLFVGGERIAILPQGSKGRSKRQGDARAMLNIRAQIRRRLRELGA